MDLGHIYERDRKVMYAIGWLALALSIGLTVTGIWQFFNHEPDTALSGYRPGLGNPPSLGESTGIASLHGFLGDVAGVLTLFGGAWFSARVIFKLSWFSASTLLIIIFSLLTGNVIRFNASVQDGEVDVTTSGYVQFFSGDAQMAITDRSELHLAWITTWTVLHVASIPVLVVSAWFTLRQARKRRALMAVTPPTWLKGSYSKESPPNGGRSAS